MIFAKISKNSKVFLTRAYWTKNSRKIFFVLVASFASLVTIWGNVPSENMRAFFPQKVTWLDHQSYRIFELKLRSTRHLNRKLFSFNYYLILPNFNFSKIFSCTKLFPVDLHVTYCYYQNPLQIRYQEPETKWNHKILVFTDSACKTLHIKVDLI